MRRVDLGDAEFARLTSLLHEAAGLVFDDSRRESLGYSVQERMRQAGSPDVASYLELVASAAGAAERQALLDEVTIPETHFFRNPPQIRALRKHVLPELLRQRSSDKRLRIWSAGCSTGEEPYTIAMLLRELVPASAGWDLQVVATDISTRALAAAREARYAERSFVMTDPVDQQRFFVENGDGGWVVREEVRDLVEFRHHNLVTDEAPFADGELDLVLCRNVTIYFDRDTTGRLMARLHSCLRDGGYLFLGHAETLWQITDAFTLIGLGDAFVYRRPPAGADRRHVLPERRTEAEPPPGGRERRSPARDRRRGAELPATPATATPEADRPGTAMSAVAARLHPPAASRPAPPAPTSAVRNPVNAVRAAVELGRYGEAADLAAEVTTVQPLHQEAHYLHGLALTNLGRDAEACIVLRKATYLAPDDGFAHFLLAGALERRGEAVAAAQSYRAAAATLGARPADPAAAELGGRRVDELAVLCAQQAERIERAAGRGAR